jgi:pilus assembly protein Flp/PilA
VLSSWLWRLAMVRQRGQGMVEYALILVLVAVVVIAVLGLMGNTIKNAFDDIVTGLNNT